MENIRSRPIHYLILVLRYEPLMSFFSLMVVFSVAVCAKHHAFSNLQQNYSFIEGAIHQSRDLGFFGRWFDVVKVEHNRITLTTPAATLHW